MKTVVYNWRLSAEKKAALQSEARRQGKSVGRLLEQITDNWLRQRHPPALSESEQAAIRKRVMAIVGSVRSEDPSRSQRASELVRDSLRKRYKR